MLNRAVVHDLGQVLIVLLANQLRQARHRLHILGLLMHRDRSTHAQLLTALPSRLPATTGRFQRIEALPVSDGHLVILCSFKHLVQVFERLCHLIQCHVASASLVQGQ